MNYEKTLGVVDCSNHSGHQDLWVAHPRTGRLVCERCHPLPAGARTISKALQRFIDAGGTGAPA